MKYSVPVLQTRRYAAEVESRSESRIAPHGEALTDVEHGDGRRAVNRDHPEQEQAGPECAAGVTAKGAVQYSRCQLYHVVAVIYNHVEIRPVAHGIGGVDVAVHDPDLIFYVLQ